MSSIDKKELFEIDFLALIEYKKNEHGQLIAQGIYHDISSVNVMNLNYGIYYDSLRIDFSFKIPKLSQILDFSLYKLDHTEEHLKYMNEYYFIGCNILINNFYAEKQSYIFEDFSVVMDGSHLHKNFVVNHKYITTLKYKDLEKNHLEKVFLFKHGY